MGKIVDVSHHQGIIDWAKASEEMDLVIIRTKYGSNTTDRQYKANIAGAEKYGVPYGLYHYAQFVSVSDAKQEAKDFLETASPNAKFLVLDVEEQTCLSTRGLQMASQAFIDECKAKGYMIGLYTGNHFYKPNGMDKVKADFLWIPKYGSKPTIQCDLWQHTDKGKVAGIKGNVDLNTIVGTKDLSWFLGTQVLAASVGVDEKYRIVTGTFGNMDQLKAARKRVEAATGWTVYMSEANGLRLMTGTFSGLVSAQRAKARLENEFKYIAYIKPQ